MRLNKIITQLSICLFALTSLAVCNQMNSSAKSIKFNYQRVNYTQPIHHKALPFNTYENRTYNLIKKYNNEQFLNQFNNSKVTNAYFGNNDGTNNMTVYSNDNDNNASALINIQRSHNKYYRAGWELSRAREFDGTGVYTTPVRVPSYQFHYARLIYKNALRRIRHHNYKNFYGYAPSTIKTSNRSRAMQTKIREHVYYRNFKDRYSKHGYVSKKFAHMLNALNLGRRKGGYAFYCGVNDYEFNNDEPIYVSKINEKRALNKNYQLGWITGYAIDRDKNSSDNFRKLKNIDFHNGFIEYLTALRKIARGNKQHYTIKPYRKFLIEFYNNHMNKRVDDGLRMINEYKHKNKKEQKLFNIGSNALSFQLSKKYKYNQAYADGWICENVLQGGMNYSTAKYNYWGAVHNKFAF